MSIFISDELIQKIKEENDVVDVVSEYVRLKKSGRNFTGLCPFHNEKTPSFSVSREKQIFKCFGCGEAGNVISFLMKIRNLSFSEACETLAERANIEIKTGDDKYKKELEAKKRLYQLNKLAARFYFDNLIKNRDVMNYLNKRGLSNKTIANFGLGYSLNNWNALENFLKKSGYSQEEMFKVGVLSRSNKNNKITYYDRFRNRVMFPVFDYNGKVIGFGGRVLDDSKPKYLNSPESEIFDKGRNMYGLNFAIKKNNTKEFILVEGYMDCISLHQAGITNAIASLGTALTVNQAKLMKKYTDKVYISYDSDNAGKKAADRGLDILTEQGFDVRVINIKDGKDPDDFIKTNGVEAFYELMKEAVSLTKFKINKVKEERYRKDDPKSVDKYVAGISGILLKLNSVERNIYIKEIAEDTGVEEQAIYDLLNKKANFINKTEENMNIKHEISVKLYKEQPSVKAARSLLKLLMCKKSVEYIRSAMDEYPLFSHTHKIMYDKILENIDLPLEDLNNKLEALCQNIEENRELVNIREMSILEMDNHEQTERFASDCIKVMKECELESKKKEIMDTIKQLEKDGKISESFEYVEKLQLIEKELKEL
ncbi:DNA primase [Hathewaya proteolytica DSM 3090]|uniref:DNA primase n=1 Tax=Hathewaya proteolytica DSM 3090 TaxID=1121331 RepID=A0A1M6JEF1_9CLOT|nr:DNA primase [Hathewaya proteolytica]SHJ45116.1 DNA primase [Hathewaya proteolytica DSM 3090]